MDSAQMLSALAALADQLDYISDEAVELVVCGGSALLALGLVDRATRDVDILALARTDAQQRIELFQDEPLPVAVVEAARLVARDLRLPDDWLNSKPADLLTSGLPDGFENRLHTRRYGRKLTVHFADRRDQICLKLYAIVNGGPARHVDDLAALLPSDDEIETAARWCLTQDASECFPALVRSCLEQIGYPSVAKSVGPGL
jgi:hypothetical protein